MNWLIVSMAALICGVAVVSYISFSRSTNKITDAIYCDDRVDPVDIGATIGAAAATQVICGVAIGALAVSCLLVVFR